MTNTGKTEVIKQYARSSKDTGSVEVQCAILTTRIIYLTEHLQMHRKDFSSRRGLLTLVGRRRKLLDYLKVTSESRYQDLIKKLDLRK